MSVHWSIGELARLARVSVRTLHHYDAVGLLPPSGRSEAGYRLYTAPDLERLQQILLFRELGFALAEIRRIMLDPEFDRRRALAAQRTLLAARAGRLESMLTAVDVALDAAKRGVTMQSDELFEVFDDFDPRDYDDEVQRHWGQTDAYAESARRTAAYSKADWQAIKAESDDITADFVAALDRESAPGDPAVQAIVDRHFRHLARWFYTPTPEMYAGLGDLYVNDPRFTRNIDKAREGLAAFQRAAMRTYAQSERNK